MVRAHSVRLIHFSFSFHFGFKPHSIDQSFRITIRHLMMRMLSWCYYGKLNTMIVTLYVSYLSHLSLMMKAQLLNMLPCFMIVLIAVILVYTLFGWLHIASVVVGCTG